LGYQNRRKLVKITENLATSLKIGRNRWKLGEIAGNNAHNIDPKLKLFWIIIFILNNNFFLSFFVDPPLHRLSLTGVNVFVKFHQFSAKNCRFFKHKVMTIFSA
jgi:hypothetical protein